MTVKTATPTTAIDAATCMLSLPPRRRLVRSALVLGAVVICALASLACVSSSPAAAESPWWHLTSGARPSYLQAGAGETAANEVQEVKVAATGGTLVLANMSSKEIKDAFEGSGSFFCGGVTPKFSEVPFNASAAELQASLEGVCGYGPGSVQVTGGPGDETGSSPYVITFVGSLAEQKVRLISDELEPQALTGTATITEKTVGRRFHPDGEIYVTAENLGDADVSGAKTPVVLKDVLPPGVKAVGVAGTKPHVQGDFQDREVIPCALVEENGVQVATCALKERLAPYDQMEMRLAVDVDPGATPRQETNIVSVSGGGAQPTSTERAFTISNEPVPFGFESYEMGLEEEGGAPATQAGAHPFQLTTTITLNQLKDINPLKLPPKFTPEVDAPQLAKDLHFRLPPGLIGNPTPIPQCTTAEFFETTAVNSNKCPPESAVGVAVVTLHEPATVGTVTFPEPIFNLEPRVGEPARFGFYVIQANSPVFIDTAVRTGADYGVTVNVSNITQTAAFLSSEVTFWGVPADPRHDRQRGWGCLFKARETGQGEVCNPTEGTNPPPFLSMPTACKDPMQTVVEGNSWSDLANVLSLEGLLEPSTALTGCNRLQFAPEIKVLPDGQEAAKPTGLTVDVHVPQEVNTNAQGLASSNVKDITVVFPRGVVLNPSAADGLQACSEEQVGLLPGLGEQGESLFTPTLPQAFCPDASKIGTVEIASPLLPSGQHVKGALYLATPAPNGEVGKNPFNGLVAMYIVAKDPISGTLVKLPGKVALDQGTGQITATFQNNPQLAFEDAEIHLFGGERAPLATPSHCGLYTTNATFTPWSGTPPVTSTSSFEVKTGPNGTPCPSAALPFNPSLQAGSPNINAGSFSPLTTTISRDDGNQDIQSVRLHFPPGLSGILTGITLCSEAQANAGTCGPESLIGHTIVSVGLGGDPFSVTGGQVFLTEGYGGAPFGLSIVNPAKAGPFDLGKVVVRAKVEVDPHTAQLTVTTDESGPYAIPRILDGIPLQIKHVNVLIDRQGFTFNPTNCNPQAITGTIGGADGASSPVSTPFQVTNCAALKFAPKFSVSTSGKNSKANGAGLTVKLSEPGEPQGSQANIAKVKVELPKQLPSRLTTLQKACTAAQFDSNPAGCPAASIIGHAIVHTPLLPVPLEGPAYFVSNGGEAFPNLIMVLQGYGVRVDLVGDTFISKAGITSSTFKTVPDVPFNTFELTLPQGPGSALATNVPAKANYSLCGQRLSMPTEFVAQSGGTPLTRNTPVSVTGCAKTKALTRAQRLARALKACRKHKKKAKRVPCEHAARKRFASPVKRAAKSTRQTKR